ncbi:hypothetical protein CFBP5507_05925 [Agrobacterium salinitolerans]|uniref:Uncharacterized protein n=1 Tax=Agrobacterium salinitolerans TaxID=1183413 RepID=A0A9X9KBL5_9HYPH|nr:hypothetical protein [Agrobacterium salinitolerans]UYZ08537.1 hypothetical protein CFBP5507_05925 [Agrobacterium salinitolerans]
MSLSSFLEKMITGRAAARRRKEIDAEISDERANLDAQKEELTATVRQHAQITNSASRIMQTMTHAMIMMEGDRGRS